MPEDEDYEDEIAEYSPKSDFSKARLVYEAMQKCMDLRSKEMMRGFWNTKLTKDGIPIKIWIEDTRQTFIGSVIALRCILSPEINIEERYKSLIDDINEEIKETKEYYSYEENVLNKDENGLGVWKKTGKKYIPEIGSKVVIKDLIKSNYAAEVIGGWDNKTNLYWDIVLEQYDLMFACLNELINKLNYFKTKPSF